jgi:hypothetical protein
MKYPTVPALWVSISVVLLSSVIAAHAQPSPDRVTQAKELLAQPTAPRADKASAILVLAATKESGRDAALQQFAAKEVDGELREKAILSISPAAGKEVRTALAAMLDKETDPNVRYALKNAIGNAERAQGLTEQGVDVRVSSTGLAGSGASGTVSVRAHSDVAGLARVAVLLPAGIIITSGERDWHGIVKAGDTWTITLQVRSTADLSASEIGATLWVKESVGETFKGAQLMKTASASVAQGAKK